jgi:hypothetical protein
MHRPVVPSQTTPSAKLLQSTHRPLKSHLSCNGATYYCRWSRGELLRRAARLYQRKVPGLSLEQQQSSDHTTMDASPGCPWALLQGFRAVLSFLHLLHDGSTSRAPSTSQVPTVLPAPMPPLSGRLMLLLRAQQAKWGSGLFSGPLLLPTQSSASR